MGSCSGSIFLSLAAKRLHLSLAPLWVACRFSFAILSQKNVPTGVHRSKGAKAKIFTLAIRQSNCSVADGKVEFQAIRNIELKRRIVGAQIISAWVSTFRMK